MFLKPSSHWLNKPTVVHKLTLLLEEVGMHKHPVLGLIVLHFIQLSFEILEYGKKYTVYFKGFGDMRV